MSSPSPLSSEQPENPESSPKSMPRAFTAFESVPFRWLMTSFLTFFLAMQGQLLVRSLLAWELTQSELSLAYVNLVVAVPMVIGSFIAGAVIDRVEKRKVVIISQLIVLFNEGLVLVLLMMGKLEYWHLLATSFIMGVTFPFIMPTRTAMIYGLVGRDKLGNAMALQAGAMNVARILGPALVGLLIPLITLEGAYFCTIGLYLVSTWTMLQLPPAPPQRKDNKSLLEDVRYSFTYVGRHRHILLCLLFGLFPMLLALPIMSLLVVFTDEIWQVGETGLGIMMATVGVGGIFGSLLVAKVGEDLPRVKVMMFAALLFSLILASFSLSKFYVLALVLLLAANIFFNISQTLNNTIIQLLSHNEVRGRMSSLVMLSLGLTPLGVLPIAYFSEYYGIDKTMFAACLILFVIVLCFLVFSPTLRKLDLAMKDGSVLPDPEESLKP